MDTNTIFLIIFCFTVGIIGIISGIVTAVTSRHCSSDGPLCVTVAYCFILSLSFLLWGCALIHDEVNESIPEPKAIDVYRGNTELEITSVNGVPKDTLVVWKKVEE